MIVKRTESGNFEVTEVESNEPYKVGDVFDSKTMGDLLVSHDVEEFTMYAVKPEVLERINRGTAGK